MMLFYFVTICTGLYTGANLNSLWFTALSRDDTENKGVEGQFVYLLYSIIWFRGRLKILVALQSSALVPGQNSSHKVGKFFSVSLGKRSWNSRFFNVLSLWLRMQNAERWISPALGYHPRKNINLMAVGDWGVSNFRPVVRMCVCLFPIAVRTVYVGEGSPVLSSPLVVPHLSVHFNPVLISFLINFCVNNFNWTLVNPGCVCGLLSRSQRTVTFPMRSVTKVDQTCMLVLRSKAKRLSPRAEVEYFILRGTDKIWIFLHIASNSNRF